MNDNTPSSSPNEIWNHLRESQRFIPPPRTGQGRSNSCTRLVLMSDTHGKHRDVKLPPGDVLIHAGDWTKMGEPGTIEDLNKYFAESGFSKVIAIAGNHDVTFHDEFYTKNWANFSKRKYDITKIQSSLNECIYLEDSMCEIKGKLLVYGSPWTPEYFDWAFNLPRGEPIRRVWRRIPTSTDILITHGPPLGRGDLTAHSGHVGCYDLLEEVQKRVKPRIHVFGHIHEDSGVTLDGSTLYVNASNCDLHYQATKKCTVVDLPHNPNEPALVVEPICRLDGKEFIDWLKENGFAEVARHAEQCHPASIPSGNVLLNEQAFMDLCDAFLLHRDTDSQNQLRCALAELYVQSFPT